MSLRVRARSAAVSRDRLAGVDVETELTAWGDPAHPLRPLLEEVAATYPNSMARLRIAHALRCEERARAVGGTWHEQALWYVELARWARERTPVGGHHRRIISAPPTYIPENRSDV